MFPKPYQARLPIYVGGNAEANLQRAAELGEGWLPAVMSPAEIRAGVTRIRELAAAAGRDLAGFEVAPQLSISLGRTQAEAEQKFYASHAYKHIVSLKNSTLKGQQGQSEARNLLGSPNQIVDRIGQYAEAGVTEITGLIFCVDTVDEVLANMEVFARDVMPQLKKDPARA
jgi:alkanesulfonate monooxygenase SsuD/methylene tetrahydromethanopterin reductase-like flavin-dependent oxidoreductase (luciferase family)